MTTSDSSKVPLRLTPDLSADWTAKSPEAAAKESVVWFVPTIYKFDVNLRDFELLFNVNEQNIIYDHEHRHSNSYLNLAGQVAGLLTPGYETGDGDEVD